VNAIFEENRAKLIFQLKDIIEFCRKHDKGIFKNYTDYQLLNVFLQHIMYGTFIVLHDEKGIKAIERYNIIDEHIFYSIDTVIRPDCRSIGTLKELFKKGVEESTFGNTLKFILYQKGQHLELGYRIHEIEKFLGEGKYKLRRKGC
jgi:hypothetical protein